MNVSAIQGTEAVNNNFQVKKAQEPQQPVANNVASNEGYIEKEPAPTDANLYKAMYGIQEESNDDKEYQEAVEKHLNEWGSDEQIKEYNEQKDIQSEEDEEYYNQYLKFKQKYE
jgi:hypothetical protein